MDNDTLHALTHAAERHFLEEGMRRLDICLSALSEDQVWFQPNGSSNSVGVILIHLAANIRQYIVSGLGTAPDVRTRDREFVQPSRHSKAELRQHLVATLEEAVTVLKGLDSENLQESYEVQGFSRSALDIVVHVIEHFSYHIGQIAYITKMLTDQQTGFYAGIDLNALNRPR